MSKRQKVEDYEEEEDSEDQTLIESLSISDAISLVDQIEQIMLIKELEHSKLAWLITSMWKLNQFLLGPDLDSTPDVIRDFHLSCDTKYAVAVCRLMKTHPNDTELHKNALLSINLLCRADTKEKQIASLIANDIAEVLASSFRTECQFEDSGVQQWALTALANIVTGSEQRKNDMLTSPCDAGSAILRSLEKHIEEPGVQHAGLLALGTFCSGSDDRKNIFLENGAIEAIVRALSQHRGHPGVIGQGIMAASNISAGRGPHAVKSCALLLDAKFDDLLTDVLESHANDATVQASGLGVAAHLCKLSQPWRSALFSKDFPALVVRILSNHIHSPNIQLWGLVAISNSVVVSTDSDVVDAELLAQVAKAVISAITHHPKNSGVVGQAFSSVGNLVALGQPTTQFKNHLVDLQFPELLVQGLKTHSSCVEVIKFGLYAAGQMINDDPAIGNLFKTAGIVEETSIALQQFGDGSSMVARLACSLLYYLVSLELSGTGRKELVELIRQDSALVLLLKRLEGNELNSWVAPILQALD